MKCCTRCHAVKLEENFYPIKARKGRAQCFTSQCRECTKVDMRRRRAAWVQPQAACIEKRCGHCGLVRPSKNFGRLIGTATGLHSWCRECQSAAARRRRASNPDGALRVKYRMEPGSFDRLYRQQDGRCAICQRKQKLGVDHDHATGAVRGLLCRKCNSGIGFFGDNEEMAMAAVRYLSQARKAA